MSRRSITAVFAAAASIILVPAAFAQAPPAHPKPAAEMAALKFFGGTWSCTGEGAMEPGGAMMKMDSSVQSTSGLGGFWQMGTVKGTPAGGMPPFEGMFHMAWDPAAKNYVMFWVDNMGGWAQTRAPGWQGDKMEWAHDGMMPGMGTFQARESFTKKSDRELVQKCEMNMGKGGWMPMGENVCKK